VSGSRGISSTRIPVDIIFGAPYILLDEKRISPSEAQSLDYTIKIGGEAGQGIQTIGDSLARVFARLGYHVFIHQDYESRIRGGHNFFQVRVSDRPIMASREKIDIVVALDGPSVANNEGFLTDGGIIIYDASHLKQRYERRHFLDVPFEELATKDGGNRIMSNTVATGAALGLLGIDIRPFFEVLGQLMASKGPKTIEENKAAARRGYDYAVTHCEGCSFEKIPVGRPNMLIDGNAALGLGAILSGCRFYSGYPMTPSTGILFFMASKAEECGIIVEQAEDEIAAVNMAIGASFAGVRSMTATAGGGFALMVEGVSLAAMTETPVVIAVGQRPAPATGLPTRTEQGDLMFVLNSGHGEFPRAVFAPGSPEQALFLVNKAFDLAEKYQITSFVLTDQYLADSQWTYDRFELDKIFYKDYRERNLDPEKTGDYRRFAYADSGISPLAIPGGSRALVVADSDEHDQEGHITEDAETRRRMVEKRLFRKLPLIRAEIDPPSLYGDSRADTLVVGWGSTYGVLREAVDSLSTESSVALLHFVEIYPFPLTDRFDFVALLKSAKRTICIENNGTSQFARLVMAETGHRFDETVNKYDGRPFLVEELTGAIRDKLG
jgi:2-oxoglutarate ferredoxin oxidoreductase subunit alpha